MLARTCLCAQYAVLLGLFAQDPASESRFFLLASPPYPCTRYISTPQSFDPCAVDEQAGCQELGPPPQIMASPAGSDLTLLLQISLARTPAMLWPGGASFTHLTCQLTSKTRGPVVHSRLKDPRL